MIILSAQDLEDYGVRQTASTITFMGKAFVRGQTFAQRLRKTAIAMAEESMARGATCLLIDFETHITVWREQKNITMPSSQHQQGQSNAAQKSNSQVVAKDHTSTLKYRGQAQATSPNPEGQAISQSQSEHRVMYRGQSVKQSSASPSFNPDVAHDGLGAKPQQPKAKRRMRYRGRWVDVD